MSNIADGKLHMTAEKIDNTIVTFDVFNNIDNDDDDYNEIVRLERDNDNIKLIMSTNNMKVVNNKRFIELLGRTDLNVYASSYIMSNISIDNISKLRESLVKEEFEWIVDVGSNDCNERAVAAISVIGDSVGIDHLEIRDNKLYVIPCGPVNRAMRANIRFGKPAIDGDIKINDEVVIGVEQSRMPEYIYTSRRRWNKLPTKSSGAAFYFPSTVLENEKISDGSTFGDILAQAKRVSEMPKYISLYLPHSDDESIDFIRKINNNDIFISNSRGEDNCDGLYACPMAHIDVNDMRRLIDDGIISVHLED